MTANDDFREVVSDELQAKVRTFFELYDPERLQSSNSDFNVLLRYVANRGLAALEDKLMRKYGVNIASMTEEDSLPGQAPKENHPQPDNDFPTAQADAGQAELEDLPVPKASVAPAASHVDTQLALQPTNYAAINPSNGQETPVRALMFQRLTEFYKEHNKEKLKGGIGNVVEYAVKNGETRINVKLFDAYGEDLTGFEQRMRQNRRMSQKIDEINMLKEEKNVLKMDPKRQKLRQELIDFFLVVEPERAALRMDPLLDYAENHGLTKLNGKLFSKYGYNLSNVPSKEQLRVDTELKVAQFSTARPPKRKNLDDNLDSMKAGDLPEYVRTMLTKYYAKFDPMMLDDGGVDRVYDWTKRNGMKKLNKKLKERYGTSFQEFVQEANEIRDDLIEFYRHRDKNKLVMGIQAILDWGLKNGRTALNQKLTAKYGIGLDPDQDLYEDVMESASQF